MRDKPGDGALRGAVGLVVVAGLASMPGRCWAVSAQLSARFHRVETILQLQRADGTPYDTTLARDAWTHTFGIRHGQRLNATTNLTTSLDWVDSYTVGQVFRTQSPAARLSITNPVYGINTIYQPTVAKTSISPVAGFVSPGAPPAAEIGNANSQRLQLSGYLAMPLLPRMDLSWERNHRNAFAFSPQQTSVSRSARVAHALGPISFRAGYADVARGIASARVQSPHQSAWDAQAGFGVNPRPNLSLGSQYTFGLVRRATAGSITDRNATQAAGVSGGYQPRKDTSVGLGYTFRHSELTGRQRLVSDAHDGSLAINYQPIPIVGLGLAGGLRTEAAQGRSNVTRSIVASSRAGGRVRRGWDVDATASHAWSWDRGRSGLPSDNIGGGARLELRRGLLVFASGQLAFTGAVTTTDERVVATTSMGVTAHPLRALDVSATQGGYGAGPRVGRATSRSRSRSLELNLRAARSVQLRAGLSEAGAQPDNRPRTVSQRYDMRWQSLGGMSLSTGYTRSDQQAGAVVSQPRGHESFTARWNALLGRSVQLGAGFAVTDPSATSESRQYDASVTKSFGR